MHRSAPALGPRRFLSQTERSERTKGSIPSPAKVNALEIIAIFLTVGWLLGLLAGYTWNGAIHLLVLFAAAAVAARIVQGDPPKR